MKIYSKMKKIDFSLIMLAMIAFLSSCGQKPKGEDAEVSEAKEVQEVSTAAMSYGVNSAVSSVTWIGSKPTGKHNGTIGISEGKIKVEGDNIVGGKIVIDMTTVENEDLKSDEESYGKLIGHLKSPDFFDVENHPVAEFVITGAEAFDPSKAVVVKEEFDSEYKPASASDHIVDNPTHKISGNLTLRGTTLGISFPAKVTMQDGKITASAKFNIDRTLWDVKYGDEASVVDKAKDKFIYNTVNVGFEIEAAKSEVL